MSDPQLPDAELDVMSCLWQAGPQSARAIRESLAAERPMTHSSICTLLGRLEAKGFVSRKQGQVGKAFIYRAAISPRPTQRRLLRDLLDRAFAGSGTDLVASLFEGRLPTDAQLNDYQKLLDELRKKRRKKIRETASSPAASEQPGCFRPLSSLLRR